MILVDTDVMIDVIRRHGPAIEWLHSLGTEVIGIPGLVGMELLQGCRNRDEQRQLQRFLRPYQRYWPTLEDCARAFDDFAAYPLGHDLGILDALIAETAVGLSTPLATFNARHYGVIPSAQTLQPYDRGA
ncbi:MAG: PIN domain-containing protein [Anaerolineae bacterium]|nr:PIN domain-containing protein [Anaerolineae bacterium]